MRSREKELKSKGLMPWYYIDIDGTLTWSAKRPWGRPRRAAIRKLKYLLEIGERVVLWSGRGEAYAEQFAKKYGLLVAACLAKPTYIVDDESNIRSPKVMFRATPKEFERWGK